ncbi:hypothetical protein [Xenorhabdus doucetiae]|uniref:hypothetical protein n=1 Tax=Xenorhabdus doucetiae TaxID=351671 RepID=UPI002B409B9C|nr:hypothetical protein [Xenorhabdus sp. 3]
MKFKLGDISPSFTVFLNTGGSEYGRHGGQVRPSPQADGTKRTGRQSRQAQAQPG